MRRPIPIAPVLVATLALAACGRQTTPASLMAATAPATQGPTLHWDWSAADLKATCDAEQAKLTQRIEQIAATPPEAATYANTAKALEDAQADLSDALAAPLFLGAVATAKDVRDAANDCDSAVSRTELDLLARPDLYRAVKAAAAKGEALDAQDRKVLDDQLLDFRRSGLELAPAALQHLTDLRKRIVDDENEYNRNLAEDRDFLVVTRAQLDGLTDEYIEHLEKTPEGLYKLTLDYPTYFPFMDNARDEATRKALEAKFDRRGGERNRDLMKEAVKLRTEAARLLGYPTHAAYVLEKRMAKTPETAQAFLDDLTTRLLPKGREELAVLTALKRQETGDQNAVLNIWDKRRYENQLKKTRFSVDDELVRQYFPLDAVLDGLFDVYQTLLSVRFVPLTDAPKWADDVRAFAIVDDAAGGAVLAYFYMDLFPRDGKYGHAASFSILHGRATQDGYQKPVSAIVANFNKPAPNAPSLLAHDEVETLFHEFGHVMHQTLTKARYESYAGSSVERDFVEAPSQMLENWVWQEPILAKMSRHYVTGKPLPADLLKNLIDAKNLDVALANLRQIVYAKLDLAYHTSTTGDVDTTAIYAQLSRDVGLIPLQDGTYPEASFNHLMGGYDAGYYGYLWSLVYAQDMFTRFEKDGLLDPTAGAAYRHSILEPGGTREPLDLITEFLGRAPNSDAFLRSLGIDPAGSHEIH